MDSAVAAEEFLCAPTIIDLRNIYKPADMAQAGFAYHSIGRSPAAPIPAPRAAGRSMRSGS